MVSSLQKQSAEAGIVAQRVKLLILPAAGVNPGRQQCACVPASHWRHLEGVLGCWLLPGPALAVAPGMWGVSQRMEDPLLSPLSFR